MIRFETLEEGDKSNGTKESLDQAAVDERVCIESIH